MRPILLAALTALAPSLAPDLGLAAPPHCPPGLAKKSPACMPPGQARKGDGFGHGIAAGDRIDGRYRHLDDPRRYRLDPRGSYYLRDDGWVVRVDPETRKVLDLIGAIDALVD
ncbi:excinuclease ABC subunit A [Rhodovulum sp. YEN HP10]|uniref:excinuclease ABC subunit A n=1 Tax=Rhodovulum sp. HP10 TaxID=3387397 RepID=UPI0039DFF791